MEPPKLRQIDPECRFCGKKVPLMVTIDSLIAFQDGIYAQDAFPYLSAGEREILVSGTCNECFENMFLHQGED